jgi:hypothetical protein
MIPKGKTLFLKTNYFCIFSDHPYLFFKISVNFAAIWKDFLFYKNILADISTLIKKLKPRLR